MNKSLALSFLLAAGAFTGRAQDKPVPTASRNMQTITQHVGEAYYDYMPFIKSDRTAREDMIQYRQYVGEITAQVLANPAGIFSAEFPEWFDEEKKFGAKDSIEFFPGTSTHSNDPHSLSVRLKTQRQIYNQDSSVIYMIEREELYVDYNRTSTLEYYKEDKQNDHDTECVEQKTTISRYANNRGEKPELTDRHIMEFQKHTKYPKFGTQSIHIRDGIPKRTTRAYGSYAAIDVSFNETRDIMLHLFNRNPEAATADRFLYMIPAGMKIDPSIWEGIDLDSLKREQRASKSKVAPK